MNTYVLGLRPIEYVFSYSAGIDFRRQNKVDPRAVSVTV